MPTVKPADLLGAREVIRARKMARELNTRAMQPPNPNGYVRVVNGILRQWQAEIRKVVEPRLDRAAVSDVERFGVGRSDAIDAETLRLLRNLAFIVDQFLEGQGVVGLIAQQFLKVSDFNFKELGRSLGINLRTTEVGIGSLIDQFRANNVQLIRSLLLDQLVETEEILQNSEGLRVEELRTRLVERFGISRSRANLIARDQTLKLNARLTQQRQQSVGVTKYKWVTSRDEAVRPYHERLDGQIFEWINPPVTDKNGRRNHPGEDFQCRCTATPILDELLGPDIL